MCNVIVNASVFGLWLQSMSCITVSRQHLHNWMRNDGIEKGARQSFLRALGEAQPSGQSPTPRSLRQGSLKGAPILSSGHRHQKLLKQSQQNLKVKPNTLQQVQENEMHARRQLQDQLDNSKKSEGKLICQSDSYRLVLVYRENNWTSLTEILCIQEGMKDWHICM